MKECQLLVIVKRAYLFEDEIECVMMLSAGTATSFLYIGSGKGRHLPLR